MCIRDRSFFDTIRINAKRSEVEKIAEEIESKSIIDIEKVMEIITKRLLKYELRKLKRVEKQPLLN